MKTINVLAIYREKIFDNRGTPIRVRSIWSRLDAHPGIAFVGCSWDKQTSVIQHHAHLTNNPWRDIRTILFLVRTQHIDVVIGHTVATAYYLIALKLVTRVKIMLEMHGFIEEEAKLYGSISTIGYCVKKLIMSLVYRWCDVASTCSDTATEILSQYNKHVVTVFGGADPELFHPEISSGNFFSRESNELVLGYVGNSRVWQGLPFLAQAYARAHTLYPELKLIVISSEKKHPDMGEGVRVIGPLEYADVPRALIDCDVLVIPRPANEVNRISFPSKLVEYMAMGKPVIASRTSDCHKIIQHGVNGFLYDPDDVAGFIACCEQVRDPAARVRVGAAAVRTVHERLTWDRQVEKIVELIKSVSSRAGGTY